MVVNDLGGLDFVGFRKGTVRTAGQNEHRGDKRKQRFVDHSHDARCAGGVVSCAAL